MIFIKLIYMKEKLKKLEKLMLQKFADNYPHKENTPNKPNDVIGFW